MAKMTPRTLSGFMELLPAPQQQMERIMEVLRKTYSLYGFTPLDTPVIESSEVLLAKAGGETEKQIYRFQKGDSDLSLRFDLTVPLAKYVALHYNELSFPFRRYQIGKVYRGERAQRGRFREFYQADIDIIGDGKLDITNEAEIPSIIYQTFSTLGLKRFQIRVNNRKILNGFYAMLGLTEKSADVMRTVDKLDKIGLDNVNEELRSKDLSEDAIARLQPIIMLKGTNREKLAVLKKELAASEIAMKGIAEMEFILDRIEKLELTADLELDLTLARGLNYYTGAIFEVKALDVQIGSITGGGRYDNLTGVFGLDGVSGVGISFGADRIFDVLNQLELYPADSLKTTQLLFVNFGEKEENYLLPLISKVRAAGIRTELYPESAKMKKQMGYADTKKIPFVAIVGENEINEGKINLKNMLTGEQSLVTLEELIERF